MAVPSYLGAGSLSALASGTTQAPPLPGSYSAGTVFLAWCCNNGGQTLAASAGWNLLGSLISGNANFNAGWWWKRAAASSGETAPTFTHGAAGSASIGHYAQVQAWNGCITSGTPMEQVANQGTPTLSTAARWGPLVTQGPDRLVIAHVLVDNDTGMSNSTRTGWTERDNNASTTGGDFYTFMIEKAEAAAGATYGSSEVMVNGTGNLASSAYWRTISFALIPPVTSRLKRHNGSAWVQANLKRHNGSIWVPASLKKF